MNEWKSPKLAKRLALPAVALTVVALTVVVVVALTATGGWIVAWVAAEARAIVV